MFFFKYLTGITLKLILVTDSYVSKEHKNKPKLVAEILLLITSTKNFTAEAYSVKSVNPLK